MTAAPRPAARDRARRRRRCCCSARAGTGKTEVLARRLARLAADGGRRPSGSLVLASTRATARRLRERVEALLDGPYEELWIGTWDAIGERLLREHSDAAGLDPFFDVLGPAERLAMLLDRLDELPLRRHEIRGNPAGLLARLLERIDALKAGADPPEPELAELCAAHDRILADAGNLDRGDVFLTLNRLLARAPGRPRRDRRAASPHLMVDELEDTTPAQRAILAALAQREPEPPLRAGAGRRRARRLVPRGPSRRRRDRSSSTCSASPQLRFWRCANERAQAQAVAREVEHLLAARRPRPTTICVLIDDPATRGGPVAAAMEERGIPFHLSGPAALFQRPEVRDAIAWLRVLADPADSAAAARALTRPPVELRSADLARLTTIARRRKLDMVSACEAALESPQIPPEARERIQAFLKLYGEASAAMEERRADVFVRRLIERVGLRRQRLFAAQPEVAERLLGLSRLAELAAAWARREPHGSTRDFVRYLSAVAEAGVEPAGGRGAARAGLGPGPRPRRRQGDGVRPRLRARARAGRRRRADRPAGALGPRPLAGRARRRRRGRPSPFYDAGARRGRRRGGGATPRSCSAPPRACTRPTGRCARRCSRRPGRRGASSRSRASTPPSTSTARSPATSSC